MFSAVIGFDHKEDNVFYRLSLDLTISKAKFSTVVGFGYRKTMFSTGFRWPSFLLASELGIRSPSFMLSLDLAKRRQSFLLS
jgi:hypothetical protein